MSLYRCLLLVCLGGLSFPALGAPKIDPIPNASIPAGKSLIIPVTAVSSNGLPLKFSATSSTNRITVRVHTNNPFWKMSVVQVASPSATGAYSTTYRGGVVTVTNVGDMTFMLFRDIAPHTVDVISGLTAGGLYTSNTIFHRVIAGFMNQGGDPSTNGTGGPVFRYDDEFHPQAMFTGTGQLALANSGKDTDGSQFFITVAPYRYGDFGYTIFGQLLRGFNVLSNINNTPTDANNRPLADVIITKASLVPDNFDTVLTLIGTNQAGVVGTIQVIADDGTGGRTTNSFTATTIADATAETPFLYPTTVTNLLGAPNKTITNLIYGFDFPSGTNNWSVAAGDQNSYLNGSNSYGYFITNQLIFVTLPRANYTGPLSFIFYVGTAGFASYDQQLYTFAIGDTAISATGTNFLTQPLVPFTNQLIATFTNGIPASSVTNFSASINWGDNALSPGVLTTNTITGRKEVRGSHTYTNSGDYPVYITIQSVLGASATAVCTSTVPPSASLVRAGTNVVLSWPAWAFSFQLLSANNTASPTWSAVTNLSSLVGYQNVVSNRATNSALYYRLKR